MDEEWKEYLPLNFSVPAKDRPKKCLWLEGSAFVSLGAQNHAGPDSSWLQKKPCFCQVFRARENLGKIIAFMSLKRRLDQSLQSSFNISPASFSFLGRVN